MGKKENIAIFEDTRRISQTHEILGNVLAFTNAYQSIYKQGVPKYVLTPYFADPAKVIVSRKRTLEAASAYKGQRVCVLSFASATNPGGGVNWGATGQEESICRCSTLYECLHAKAMWYNFYGPHRKANDPLGGDDLIFTPDIMVFKSDTENPVLLDQSQWFVCSVITCAAPDLRPDPKTGRRINISNDRLKELHIKRIRNILSVAAANGCQVMILGAFGCGTNRNPPEVVASAMKEAVEEFKCCFETIEFAVFCEPRDEENYEVFNRILGSENNT